jgi:hypothetical protein
LAKVFFFGMVAGREERKKTIDVWKIKRALPFGLK